MQRLNLENLTPVLPPKEIAPLETPRRSLAAPPRPTFDDALDRAGRNRRSEPSEVDTRDAEVSAFEAGAPENEGSPAPQLESTDREASAPTADATGSDSASETPAESAPTPDHSDAESDAEDSPSDNQRAEQSVGDDTATEIEPPVESVTTNDAELADVTEDENPSRDVEQPAINPTEDPLGNSTAGAAALEESPDAAGPSSEIELEPVDPSVQRGAAVAETSDRDQVSDRAIRDTAPAVARTNPDSDQARATPSSDDAPKSQANGPAAERASKDGATPSRHAVTLHSRGESEGDAAAESADATSEDASRNATNLAPTGPHDTAQLTAKTRSSKTKRADGNQAHSRPDVVAAESRPARPTDANLAAARQASAHAAALEVTESDGSSRGTAHRDESTENGDRQAPSAQKSSGAASSETPAGSSASRDGASNDPAAAPKATTARNPAHVDHARFVQRVSRALHVATERGGSLRLRLSPPELGSVRLEVSLRDGVMRAHLEAESASTRNTLLESLPSLRERLAEQGIKIERFDVDVRDERHGESAAHGEQQADPERSDRRPVAQQRASDQSETESATDGATESAPAIDDDRLNVIV